MDSTARINAAATAETSTSTGHEVRLDKQCGSVRAVCSCGWMRFGAWYPTRTAEGEQLARKDREMHLRNPEVPAFKPHSPLTAGGA